MYRYAVLRFILLAVSVSVLAFSAFGQGNTKDVYQRDSGPGFFKKVPEVNPKDVPSRELAGIVRDENDDPLAGAIVTLTNLKTKASRSFVTKDDGRYRFDQLIKADDYQVQAKMQGRVTEAKSLSTFDPREKPTLNLKFEKAKAEEKKEADTSAKSTTN